MNIWNILAALLLAVAVSFGRGEGSLPEVAASNHAPTETSLSEESETSSYSEDYDVVANAIRNQPTDLPVRISMYAGNPWPEIVAELESPSRAYFGIGASGIVVYDGTFYIRENGQWFEDPSAALYADAVREAMLSPDVSESIDAISAVQRMPDETKNGDEVAVYRVEFDTPEDHLGTIVTLMYVNKSDGRVHTIETIESEVGSAGELSTNMTTESR